MNTDIRLVAFDLGNVLCTVDEITPAKELAKIADKPWEDAHEIAFGQKHKQLFERGTISFTEHAQRAIAELGIQMSVNEFIDIYDSALIPSENMFPTVSRIAESYRIALVSNTSEPHWISARRFLPFSPRLDPVIVSYAVESMKPEPEFYRSLLDESGVDANQILFIDDLAVNIETARTSGMIGHQFISQAIFESEMANLGVL